MGDIQERVAAAADPADALRVGVVVLGVGKLGQRLLQLVAVTEGAKKNKKPSTYFAASDLAPIRLYACRAEDISGARTRLIRFCSFGSPLCGTKKGF